MKNNRKYLCFINSIGIDIEGNNIYEFLFTEDIDTFFQKMENINLVVYVTI